MEEDATSKDRELSGISRALFPDEDSDEEDHESVQVVERATRLVDDLQTEKSTSEAVQRDLELARQELARLQDSLQKAEEQLVEKLDEGLSRLKDLESELGESESTKLVWRPTTTTELDLDGMQSLMRLVDALEDDDDVQRVTTNFEASDEVMEQL